MNHTEYRYSTALSGLLKAALRARTTVSRSQLPPPMSRICWTVDSKVVPATRFDAAWPYTSVWILFQPRKRRTFIWSSINELKFENEYSTILKSAYEAAAAGAAAAAVPLVGSGLQNASKKNRKSAKWQIQKRLTISLSNWGKSMREAWNSHWDSWSRNLRCSYCLCRLSLRIQAITLDKTKNMI